MSLYHNFTPTLEAYHKGETVRYKKCQRCKKVMFLEGDDWFNLFCMEEVKDREKLRESL